MSPGLTSWPSLRRGVRVDIAARPKMMFDKAVMARPVGVGVVRVLRGEKERKESKNLVGCRQH